MKAEDLKDIAETIALVCAAGFFIFKLISGYLIGALDLSLSSVRRTGLSGNDLLVITAKLKKGDLGSVILHDAQIRFTFDGIVLIKPLIGFYRQGDQPDDIGSVKRRTINWEKLDDSAPLLRLPPDEEAEFSCYAEIPRTSICVVELAVLGRERFWRGYGQWRASHVSPPEG